MNNPILYHKGAGSVARGIVDAFEFKDCGKKKNRGKEMNKKELEESKKHFIDRLASSIHEESGHGISEEKAMLFAATMAEQLDFNNPVVGHKDPAWYGHLADGYYPKEKFDLLREYMREIDIVSYPEACEVLSAASEKAVTAIEKNRDDDLGFMGKYLFVFAGPNGSGKSTVISNLIKDGICPQYYICPDSLVDIKRDEAAYIKAMKYASELREKAIRQGFPITVETVFSSDRMTDFISNAKKQGYTVFVVYIITSNPEINIERVAARASQGGHFVPDELVRARYTKCLDRMAAIINGLADFALVYDNSTNLQTPELTTKKPVGNTCFRKCGSAG